MLAFNSKRKTRSRGKRTKQEQQQEKQDTNTKQTSKRGQCVHVSFNGTECIIVLVWLKTFEEARLILCPHLIQSLPSSVLLGPVVEHFADSFSMLSAKCCRTVLETGDHLTVRTNLAFGRAPLHGRHSR